MTEIYPGHEAHEQQRPLTPEQVLQTGAELMRYFGVEADPLTFNKPEQYHGYREALRQLNPRYKGERPLVRYELEQDTTEWPAEMVATTMRTAEAFGMLDTETPLEGDYQAVIVLGAARQSNLDRARYGAQAIRVGAARAKSFMGVGSRRLLPEAEQRNTANYAPGAEVEFDLVAGAGRVVAKENPGLAVESVFVDDDTAGNEEVMSAALRALQKSENLPKGAIVAAVTTQIYRTATQLDLARVARRYGLKQSAVAGHPSAPENISKRTTSTYFSEVLRTMKAAVDAVEEGRQRRTDARARMEQDYERLLTEGDNFEEGDRYSIAEPVGDSLGLFDNVQGLYIRWDEDGSSYTYPPTPPSVLEDYWPEGEI